MSVDVMPPDATGRWWVTTQGSRHLFDFDNEVYERHQMDGLNPLEFDRTPLVLDRNLIYVWPEVGSTFVLAIPLGVDGQWVWTRFRRSSLIVEITREGAR